MAIGNCRRAAVRPVPHHDVLLGPEGKDRTREDYQQCTQPDLSHPVLLPVLCGHGTL